jgi:hypothetical protein
MFRIKSFARMITVSAHVQNASGCQSAFWLLLYLTCREYRLFRHSVRFWSSLIVSFPLWYFRSASFFLSRSSRHGLYLSSQ